MQILEKDKNLIRIDGKECENIAAEAEVAEDTAADEEAIAAEVENAETEPVEAEAETAEENISAEEEVGEPDAAADTEPADAEAVSDNIWTWGTRHYIGPGFAEAEPGFLKKR